MLNLSDLKAILLDMDGVLWRGSEPILNIEELFNIISNLELNVLCITNNSTKSISTYQERLSSYGAHLDEGQIITSAQGTSNYLAKKHPGGGPVYIIGEDGLRDALSANSFIPIDKGDTTPPLAVVVGLDSNYNYQKLKKAAQLVIQNVPLIGTNPDLTIPTPSGAAPGAGALIRAIEAAADQKAIIVGKPEKHLFLQALEIAGCQPREAIMIGDRLETDIAGAQRLDIRTGLVLSGITDLSMASLWEPEPDIVAKDAVEILNHLTGYEN